jgi:hypothetical protein
VVMFLFLDDFLIVSNVSWIGHKTTESSLGLPVAVWWQAIRWSRFYDGKVNFPEDWISPFLVERSTLRKRRRVSLHLPQGFHVLLQST